MQARLAAETGKPVGVVLQAFRLGLLFLPTLLLLSVSVRLQGGATLVLLLGSATLALGCLLILCTRPGQQPAGPAVIMLYVIGLSWLVLGTAGIYDWFLHLAQAVLLVVPLVFFARQCLLDSGASAMRRARILAARLAARKDWPAELWSCRLLPEVKALRESLHVDASPALDLLTNPQPAVRVAALAALEFRPTWRPGQPQVVLQLAQRAKEPEVRAAAVNALGNIDDRLVIESLAELMRDGSPLVRLTTAEALLWNTEQRWEWIRHALRGALADPVGEADGPLKLPFTQATPEAIGDLHSWAAEKGILALRAALTLSAYYSEALSTGVAQELVDWLRNELVDPHTPAILRLELARLLHHHHALDRNHLARLLDPSMPAPVRLIAVEALLSAGDCPEALAALHELARLPNREIALSTAEVVQRRLGVDLGLPRGPLPAVQSRTAAEVARRVLAWATEQDVANTPPPALRKPHTSRPVSHSSRIDLGQ
jgi:HEAT repeat protein